MDPDQWERVSELFEAALELPEEERASFVAQAGGESSEVQAALAELVAAHSGADDFLVDMPWGALSEEMQFGPTITAGTVIGPYRVLNEIGRGGMAVVYLAERADGQFEQRVALKLISPGNDSKDVVQRFQQERQILALLNHPNIARLLDGGLAGDGRLYFAMEYVEGTPIDRYCDERRLSIDERVRLFVAVARAVQYAHRNLIVHRDLKPSNILVDESGQPKLLDFGIAKLTDPRDVPHAVPPTRTNLRVMTPEYASPEQVLGKPVAVASDVFQLGTLLYDLLTGQRPLRPKNRTAGEVERAICHEQPLRPSHAVTGTKTAADTGMLSKVRGTTPADLRARLSGDLDKIVLMALAKEPERRYESVADFADDLERFGKSVPVRARKPTLIYRSSRFVRRHRLAVVAAMLVMLSLSAGLIGTVWQASQARQQRDHARDEAVKSGSVIEFLVEVFETADPEGVANPDITARELLDSAASRLEGELREQPEVQAEMMNAIGRIYRNLGLYDRAQTLLHDALTIRRERFGSGESDIADSLTELATLRYVKKDFAGAEALHREALAIRARWEGPDSSSVAQSMHGIGMSLYGQGQYDDAEQMVRQALATRRSVHSDEHRDIAESLHSLAVILHARGKLDDAEPLYRESLRTYTQLLGDNHPLVATTGDALAALLGAKGDFASAAPVMRRSLQIALQNYGNDHEKVASAAMNLALMLARAGEFTEAESRSSDALGMRRRIFGNDNPALSMSLVNCGYILYLKGDLKAAEPYYREAVTLARSASPSVHPRLGIGAFWYGRLLADLQRHAEAVELLGDALSVYEVVYGAGDDWSFDARLALAASLAQLGRMDEAESVLRTGRELAGKQSGYGEKIDDAIAHLSALDATPAETEAR